MFFFFFSSRRRHTRFSRDWSSDVCSSDLELAELVSPSLFAEGRVIVLDGAHEAGQEIAAAIAGYAKAPADGVVLVVLHNGAGRARGVRAQRDPPGRWQERW